MWRNKKSAHVGGKIKKKLTSHIVLENVGHGTNVCITGAKIC